MDRYVHAGCSCTPPRVVGARVRRSLRSLNTGRRPCRPSRPCCCGPCASSGRGGSGPSWRRRGIGVSAKVNQESSSWPTVDSNLSSTTLQETKRRDCWIIYTCRRSCLAVVNVNVLKPAHAWHVVERWSSTTPRRRGCFTRSTPERPKPPSKEPNLPCGQGRPRSRLWWGLNRAPALLIMRGNELPEESRQESLFRNTVLSLSEV